MSETTVIKPTSKFFIQEYTLDVKRSSAGLGLFAGQDLPKGVCIIEYVGKPLTEEESQESNSKYLFEINSKLTIDGTMRSNKARYINHACKPNCEVEIYKKRIFVFTKKAIKKGEELTYDYGKDYFNEYIKPHGCRCLTCTAKR